MGIDFTFFIVSIVIFAIVLLGSMIRILREYERGVIFTLGRFYKVKGPGLIIVIPFIQQMSKDELESIMSSVGLKNIDIISHRGLLLGIGLK